MPILCGMKPIELVRHYGTQVRAAAALGVSQPTISGWIVSGQMPPLRQYQAQRLTRGKLKISERARAQLQMLGVIA